MSDPSPFEEVGAPKTDSRTLANRARAFAEHHAMFPQGVPVLALVSGGGDSVALLRLLADESLGGSDAREEHSRLAVLHVNHMLRGAESDADQAFVEGLCEELGVEAVSVRFDVAAFAQSEGLNVEDAGRRIRYRFAQEELDARCDRLGVAREVGRVAVAHTLDDRIETFFMRVLTGAGAGGLSSIAPVRGRIVRPLLAIAREDVREWLRDIGQSWREDESNADVERLRALIRHELVPIAESVNPKFRDTLARTLDLVADDDGLLDEMAQAFAHDFADVDLTPPRIAFERAPMLTLSRPMARRTIRAAMRQAFPEASRLEAAHVEALVDGLAEEGFARDLPGGLRASSGCDRMLVTRRPGAPRRVTPGLLELPGMLDLGHAGSITADEAEASDTSGMPNSVVIDAGSFEGPLVVDGVRPGDRMRPLGMQGTRKLSDLLIDAKVPQTDRAGIPVVRSGERIIWLAGVRMSEDVRVGDKTARSIRLTWDAPNGLEDQR